MPSLRIAAVRKMGAINIGLVFPSPQPKFSDTAPANLPDATPIKGADNIPTDHAKFFTSTPTKPVAISGLQELEESAILSHIVKVLRVLWEQRTCLQLNLGILKMQPSFQ